MERSYQTFLTHAAPLSLLPLLLLAVRWDRHALLSERCLVSSPFEQSTEEGPCLGAFFLVALPHYQVLLRPWGFLFQSEGTGVTHSQKGLLEQFWGSNDTGKAF